MDYYKINPNPRANAATSPPWTNVPVTGAAAECEEVENAPVAVEVEDEWPDVAVPVWVADASSDAVAEEAEEPEAEAEAVAELLAVLEVLVPYAFAALQ